MFDVYRAEDFIAQQEILISLRNNMADRIIEVDKTEKESVRKLNERIIALTKERDEALAQFSDTEAGGVVFCGKCGQPK